MQKIIYVYGSNQSEEKVLLGFEVYSVNDKNKKRGYYVGKAIPLLNMNDKEVSVLIGEKNMSNLIEYALKINAIGLIYFPETKTYGFLEPTDIVLESKLELLTIAEELEQEKTQEYIPSDQLDPDNSLLELRNLTLIRQKTSDR